MRTKEHILQTVAIAKGYLALAQATHTSPDPEVFYEARHRAICFLLAEAALWIAVAYLEKKGFEVTEVDFSTASKLIVQFTEKDKRAEEIKSAVDALGLARVDAVHRRQPKHNYFHVATRHFGRVASLARTVEKMVR